MCVCVCVGLELGQGELHWIYRTERCGTRVRICVTGLELWLLHENHELKISFLLLISGIQFTLCCLLWQLLSSKLVVKFISPAGCLGNMEVTDEALRLMDLTQSRLAATLASH